jgi:hypothetical protein
MSTIIAPTLNSIAVDNRRPVQFMAPIFVDLVNHLWVSIHTVGDLLERRFAEFADLPYQDALSRQQWGKRNPRRCGPRFLRIFSG